MKKTQICTLLAAATLLGTLSVNASADNGSSLSGFKPYVGLRAGITSYDTDDWNNNDKNDWTHTTNNYFSIDNAFALNPYVGAQYTFNNVIAVNAELEYLHNFGANVNVKNHGDVGELTSSALLISAYAEFNPNGIVSPYVGAGFGPSWEKVDYKSSFGGGSDSNHSTAAHITGGIQFNLTHNFAIDTNIRYMSLDGDTGSVNYMGGIKVSF